ncbi:sensor histidine kinase [Proteiniphilum sp.]|uniref:sensor histidine kinase n=1 Tax=Proteiniphilum sp. TaxID=1926877 RepID=UPI002B20FF13|nr:histidine kinase [Proteiniphilum sp.]MEA4917198.1 histidine kinase [Proteiniphilum sp.]
MDQLLKPKQRGALNNVFTHILLWGVIFILPYFFMDSEHLFYWQYFMRSLSEMLGFMLVFYVNYFLLINKFLFKGKTRQFILYNLLLIVAAAFLMYYGRGLIEAIIPELRPKKRMRPGGANMHVLFLVRNSTSLFLMAGLSVALKMTVRWFEVDNERKELAKAKSEAELQNLKNQINPHFLLNTLNNIYALIEFDPPKAQQAVMDLSKMLRHLLYDNKQTFVPLHQEATFMRNYIELMRIRLPGNVKLTTDFSYSESGNTLISPLIFISLIENAFKHGISGDKPSFIDISLKEHTDGKVEFIARNSYFPKSGSDKSGSGIGLELVKKKLELLYPGNYQWNTSMEEDVYSTRLLIDTKKQSDDTQLLDRG